jgi:hypothetical protein
MVIIVDDDQPELAAAVKEAESIEKLCRHKIPFSMRRRWWPVSSWRDAR